MIWRKNVDFKDFDFYNFPIFNDVLARNILTSRIVSALSPFQIPSSVPTLLSEGIYDYCYGKKCNSINETRWRYNFLGEISIYLLEQGRYLQAYFRDVNKDIEIDNSTKVVSEGEQKAGKVDTKKTGSAENSQASDVQGSNQQQGQLNLGDTLTVLNNQTTSTRYLASSNEESYSTGSITENHVATVGKNDTSKISVGMENGASLSDTQNVNETNTTGKRSPIDIALNESNFNLKEWMEPLFKIIDTYFTPEGGEGYA